MIYCYDVGFLKSAVMCGHNFLLFFFNFTRHCTYKFIKKFYILRLYIYYSIRGTVFDYTIR